MYVCMCTLCAWSPKKPGEDDSLKLGLLMGCKPTWMLETKSRLSPEQTVLLTTKPDIEPQNIILKYE